MFASTRENRLTNGEQNVIIDAGSDEMITTQPREMALGLRKPSSRLLTADEITSLEADIAAIGADKKIFIFNDEYAFGTSYYPNTDRISIKGNILPDLDSGSTHPRDLMSARAVLAHEYYGHRPFRRFYLAEDTLAGQMPESQSIAREWVDEFRASYTAAKVAPGLSAEDRYYLILDALERAREAGVTITHNDFIRGILYEHTDGPT
ncbi:MAG: hypothetical protein LBN97_06015 [Oscillospiraceae bacterium]|nr:hypothetical protein [Oscillospiraceae bacterium]